MNTNLLRLTTLTVREAVLCRKRKILISQSLYEEKQDAFTELSLSLLTTMKGIPLAYNKDMQEDKELVFDAIDTTKGCLALFTGMLKTMRFQQCPHGRKCKARFHKCDGCCGLSRKSQCSVQGCPWYRWKTCIVLH